MIIPLDRHYLEGMSFLHVLLLAYFLWWGTPFKSKFGGYFTIPFLIILILYYPPIGDGRYVKSNIQGIFMLLVRRNKINYGVWYTKKIVLILCLIQTKFFALVCISRPKFHISISKFTKRHLWRNLELIWFIEI